MWSTGDAVGDPVPEPATLLMLGLASPVTASRRRNSAGSRPFLSLTGQAAARSHGVRVFFGIGRRSQRLTFPPSWAARRAASTTARARTPSAAGTRLSARPMHASRNDWSSSRSGSSRPVGSSSFPVSTASQCSPRSRCSPRWRVTTDVP
ncbi:MAG: hypothetical protein DMD96_30630 [Candidatus Rokuibacteriota bacterium]|nr:MAG: hypothetical protein DMD96_30630 [Candidatus Rokubacteria bacterium]